MSRNIKIGDAAKTKRVFTEKDVESFAHLSLDFNKIHLDPKYAEGTTYGQRIVHGMLVSSLFSGLLGQKIPGQGTIYLSQTIDFKAPVYYDEVIHASVEVIKIRKDKPIITLRTLCQRVNGEILVEGEAVVKMQE